MSNATNIAFEPNRRDVNEFAEQARIRLSEMKCGNVKVS